MTLAPRPRLISILQTSFNASPIKSTALVRQDNYELGNNVRIARTAMARAKNNRGRNLMVCGLYYSGVDCNSSA